MMKMTEINREKISSVKRVKNSTMFDSENTLRTRTSYPTQSPSWGHRKCGGAGIRTRSRVRADGRTNGQTGVQDMRPFGPPEKQIVHLPQTVVSTNLTLPHRLMHKQNAKYKYRQLTGGCRHGSKNAGRIATPTSPTPTTNNETAAQ